MFAGPKTLQEFDQKLPDEDAAEKFLIEVRWPKGVCCPRCGSRNLTRIDDDRRRWQCNGCRHQPSIRSDTALHGTKLPLRDILKILWKAAREGASVRSIALQFRYRYETVFDLVHKMRSALAERRAWQLASSPVHVAAAEIPVPKLANGDPPERRPVVVGLAVEQTPAAPAVASVRFEVALAPQPAVADVLTRTREEHVARNTEVVVEPECMTLHPLRRRSTRVLEGEVRCLQVWLKNRFGGVSRRYLPNYLAQSEYRSNRAHLLPNLFAYTLRRVMTEPWRPRSDMALLAP